MFLVGAIYLVGMWELLTVAYFGRVNAQMFGQIMQPSYYQDTSNEEKRVKNNKVRGKLEVQSCCQMLNVRLSFEPVSIQIFLSFSLENAAICRKGFFPLVWKKPQQLSFDGGIA